MPYGRIAIVVAALAIAAGGYWWTSRPPGRYRINNSGLYPIKVDGKYGFMDRSGKTIIKPQFDDVNQGFSEGLASVKVGTKWGYIDTKGVVAITPQFDTAFWFRYARAPVQVGDRWGVIDKGGKYTSGLNLLSPAFFHGDLAAVRLANGLFGILNSSGKIEFSGQFEMVQSFTEGLAAASSGGRWGYIDTTGKWVIDPQFGAASLFADGLAPVEVGGRTGYVDKKGAFVINPQYDSGAMFFDGYARFSTGGKYGFLDTKGNVAVAAKFFDAGWFSDGLAPVRTEEGWGYIDRTGKMVVPPQFDRAERFLNNLARVTVAGKEAYVTTSGKFVVDPFPGHELRAVVLANDLAGEWRDDEGGWCMKIDAVEWPTRFIVKAGPCRTGVPIEGVEATVVGNGLRGSDGKLKVERVTKSTVGATFEFTSKGLVVGSGQIVESRDLGVGSFKKAQAGSLRW